jgi:hypothetical protein
MREDRALQLLCELTLNTAPDPQMLDELRQLSLEDRREFLRLANSHHVIIRGFQPVKAWAAALGDTELCTWAEDAINNERSRVNNALAYLQEICRELEAAGCPVTVMKSLDHYPDIGSDLDLYTTGRAEKVQQVMREKFNAVPEARSWGDRVAQKHNFKIPGLPESVEIHVQRLGQMGEHTALARRFVTRRVETTVDGRTFFVPAPEERIIVATLQRMYRHFYFRICDLVNSAAIFESGNLDITELKRAAEYAGIWPGVASYLKIVSDFATRYRGRGLDLPAVVTRSAIVSGDDIYPRKDFLRVPIASKGAALYTQQVTHAAFSGDVPGTFRLGLLPYLASAAAISYKLTGSDKGIW